MEVTHLALLRELADRGSVTEVAYATGRTASAVSQQLKALQREAGVVLIERVGRGVRLTDAGRALAEASVGIATAIAAAEASWQDYLGEAGGTVRISLFNSAAELLLPGLLDRLAQYPAVTLDSVDQDVSEDDFAALTVDHDIVVAHRSDDRRGPRRSALTVVPLIREPLDVALPLDHPLAQRASVSPADVISENWIAPPEDFPIDRVLTAIAVRAGSPVRVVRRTTHLPLTEKLVARGHGVALLPRHTSAEHAAGSFALVPLTDIRAGRQIEALLRPDRAARRAVRVVLDALVAEASGSTWR
ncbi:MAG: DNA-binding transcriptional regulator, LysR family [Propionibacteriaceae bacterium]|jgi:DNA-binding transcriptional LysR family regulator|nr:DNA-binding transcriptional regulator, LysR family [Propionibacteriaceae bacterium]